MISALRAEPYHLLQQKLDAAVAADPSLAPARARLLLPLQVLEALSSDAEAALADDPLAANRMRLLLVAGGAQAVPHGASSALFPSNPDGGLTTTAPAAAGDDAGGYDGGSGLLHLGALVVVALAAGRAGAASRLEQQLARTVFGLALASGLAEATAGMGGAALTDAQLRVLLTALADPDARSSAWSAAVGSFVCDPAERGRWACLAELQALVLREVSQENLAWDGARAKGIAALEPPQACPGAELTLKGSPAVEDESSVRVVFASSARAPLASPGVFTQGHISTRVPEGATAGWLGYTDGRILSAANALRAKLRKLFADENTRIRCLDGAPIPVDAIRDLGDPPTPPILGSNRFRGGLPALRASLAPARPSPEETLTLRWSSEGAAKVALDPGGEELELQGARAVPASSLPADGALTIRASNACGESAQRLAASVRRRLVRAWAAQGQRQDGLVEGLPFTVHAAYEPPGAPASAVLSTASARIEGRAADGEAIFELEAASAADGFTASVDLFAPGEKAPDDTARVGPLPFGALERCRVVVLRPAVFSPELARVSDAELESAAKAAGAQLGLQLEVVEPLWVEDEELAIAGPVSAPDSPGIAELLERLELLAGRQPNLEDACWVALVPDEGSAAPPSPASASRSPRAPPLAVAVPAEAARSVAVATPRGLGAALRSLPPAKPVVPRLRLVGTLERGPHVALEPPRIEARGSGPGASEDTGFELVALGAQGRELASRPLKAVRAGFPVRFACLLPVTQDIAAVEIRLGPVVALHLDRPPGAPAVANAQLSEGLVLWEYQHTQGMAPTVSIEMGQGGGWCPVARPGPCARQAILPLARLRRGGEVAPVRVAASDGWTGIEVPCPARAQLPARHVVARQAGPGLFWADTKDGGQWLWSLDGKALDGRASVQLEVGARGTLVLSVKDEAGSFSDSRVIGG